MVGRMFCKETADWPITGTGHKPGFYVACNNERQTHFKMFLLTSTENHLPLIKRCMLTL
jgi:hypothetical protein